MLSGGDGHGGHVPIAEGAVRRLHQGLHVNVRAAEPGDGVSDGEIFQRNGRQQAALAVDGVGEAVALIVGHDLHDAAVHIELAGDVPGDLGQVQGRIAVFISGGGGDVRRCCRHCGAQLERQGEGQGSGRRPSCFSHAVSSCDFVLDREPGILPI